MRYELIDSPTELALQLVPPLTIIDGQQRLTTLQLLLQLAQDCDLRGRIDAMFRGEKINTTEKRAVLHVGKLGQPRYDRPGAFFQPKH